MSEYRGTKKLLIKRIIIYLISYMVIKEHFMSFLSVTAQTKSCAQLLRNITFIVDFS